MIGEFVIRNAEVAGRPGLDVWIVDGRVAEIGVGLRPPRGDTLDARGGAVLPGLVDHHLHLHALAASRMSVRCGPPDVRGPDDLARALSEAESEDDGGWVRGVGYVETVAGLLDAAMLDRLHSARPVRVQHRSGALWMLNSAALRATGLVDVRHPGVERDSEGQPTGRVWRADDALRERLPSGKPPGLAGVGRDLARLGVTAVTDATPDLAPGSLAALMADAANGQLPQRLHLLGVPPGSTPVPERGTRVTVGPYKIVLADSEPPDLVGLMDTITRVHSEGRAVAVHSVTRESLMILLAAFDEVGCVPGDRIEHASIVPAEVVGVLRERGLTIVTQPGFIADRGDDYRARVDERDHPDLYRCRSLLDAGVALALSSDAPYGPLDPWTVIAAAVGRRTESGVVLGESERIDPPRALEAYLAPPDNPGGVPRRVRPGVSADLVVLDVPLREMLGSPDSAAVGTVLVDGRVVYAG
ncbi:putative amidohydrolase YtcJ [Rhodococcus sp. OK519]|uniref:amidohydrolase family protein n=1 Tax=Rhodococcus sp. OK519 TaxID=2135729 RepID=UPI000D36552F|nr:putative amidohydrolase YtcJ [Rhodococcus sp. OK519]